MTDLVSEDSSEEKNEAFNSDLSEPKAKIQSMFQSLELMAMQRNKGGFDISTFDSSQRDKLLEILGQNEDNAFAYHSKKLDVSKEVTLAHISSKTITQKTKRYVSIGIILFISIVTLLILFFKDDFFDRWLSLVIGLFGGYGFGKYNSEKEEKIERLSLDDQDEE